MCSQVFLSWYFWQVKLEGSQLFSIQPIKVSWVKWSQSECVQIEIFFLHRGTKSLISCSPPCAKMVMPNLQWYPWNFYLINLKILMFFQDEMCKCVLIHKWFMQYKCTCLFCRKTKIENKYFLDFRKFIHDQSKLSGFHYESDIALSAWKVS